MDMFQTPSSLYLLGDKHCRELERFRKNVELDLVVTRAMQKTDKANAFFVWWWWYVCMVITLGLLKERRGK